MFIRRFGHLRIFAFLICGAAIIAALLVLETETVRGQAALSKLSTTLADLSAAVPQETAAVSAQPAVVTPFRAETAPVSVGDALRSRRLRMNARGEVQVYVLVTGVTDDVLAQLGAAGATPEIADVEGSRIQARIPASRLTAIASLPFVTFIRLPTYAVQQVGAAATEGDAILGSNVARQQFSLDGSGVRVGVISDGIKGIFAAGCTTCGGAQNGPIATGDLPPATGTRASSGVLTSASGGITGQSFRSDHDLEGKPPSSPPCGFAGAGAEGTALLEIVHDLAPAAQLSFSNAETSVEFTQAVNALALANDVVVDDLGFFGEAFDGTSTVSRNTANALNNPANRIRTYVTSVGNAADSHYFGRYADSGIDGSSIGGLTTPGRLHLFQRGPGTIDVLSLGDRPYNVISLPTNGEVIVVLHWDDAAGRSASNYDLYLVRQSTNAVVARSTDSQTGGQDPLEAIDFTNAGAADLFRIVVQNVRNQAQSRQLNLFAFQPQCAQDGPRLLAAGRHERQNFNTAAHSVLSQSDAGGSPVSVISVGAICSGSAETIALFAGRSAPDESCLDRLHTTAEFFSSQGPTGDGRIKPDIAAIDGVSITGAGNFPTPFFGTSAAAPHVAGEAALLLQAAPCLASGAAGALDAAAARGALRGLILAGAQPLTDVAPDNVFGAGIANVFASIQRTLPQFQGPPALVIPGDSESGARIQPSDLGFADPNQCAVTRLSWTGGCGLSPATSLTCPFGTTAILMAASNNGTSFSTPVSVAITISDFAIEPSPAVAAVRSGETASYRIAVSSRSAPYTRAVALSCANVPPGATCSFSPALVQPGTDAVESTLTIGTTAHATGSTLRSPDGRSRLYDAPAWLPAPLLVFVVLQLARWITRRSRNGRRPVLARWVATAFAAAALGCTGGGSGRNGIIEPVPTGSPAVHLSVTSLGFDSQTVRSTGAPRTVTLENTGTGPLEIASISTSGDFAQTNDCGVSVAAGSTCRVAVLFTPTSAGARSGSLTISDSASHRPRIVQLKGIGVSGTAGTPAGTYQIAITGASGTLVRSTAVSLSVQ